MFPILVEFGPITIFSLWFFVVLGMLAGALLLTRLAKRNRIKLTLLSDHSFVLFLWVLLISRLVFIIFHPSLYFTNFSIETVTGLFAIWDKGLSFWGGLVAWISGIVYLAKKEQENPVRLFEIMTPAILLGMLFGTIGVFLDGTAHGSPTELPWGIAFSNANVRYVSPVHPTQLYAFLYFGVTLGCVLFLLRRLRGTLPGIPVEIAIFLASVFRFLEEFVRGDDVINLGPIRIPQLIALAIAIYMGHRLYKNKELKAVLQSLVKS
ncbi:hypothetical protein COV82_01755 [Candidatus Peregrinibacteria bacterium CG11_big_fil_rev_8_21_14_0_20_46_8]|nr:MAG: hypothetical protein COV82_01755 [Candidatus Peregrinibacteria bacterium CG11_big_fil_rev_8_21_14_0_20_46_8]